jgi:hypothetical protein
MSYKFKLKMKEIFLLSSIVPRNNIWNVTPFLNVNCKRNQQIKLDPILQQNKQDLC